MLTSAPFSWSLSKAFKVEGFFLTRVTFCMNMFPFKVRKPPSSCNFQDAKLKWRLDAIQSDEIWNKLKIDLEIITYQEGVITQKNASDLNFEDLLSPNNSFTISNRNYKWQNWKDGRHTCLAFFSEAIEKAHNNNNSSFNFRFYLRILSIWESLSRSSINTYGFSN